MTASPTTATKNPDQTQQVFVDSRRKQRARVPVNVRWGIGTVVVLVVLIGGGFGARAWNLERNARKYLAKADAAAKEDETVTEFENLKLFLQLRPKDAEMRVRIAKTYDKVATDPASKVYLLSLYDQAALLVPDRADLLDRRLELLVQLGRFRDAENLAKRMIDQKHGGPKTSWALALAMYSQLGPDARVTPADVEKACVDALRENPGNLQLSFALAAIYRDHFGQPTSEENATKADAIIDQLVADSPKNAEAMLARNQYNQRYRPELADDWEKPLEDVPQNFELLLAAGSSAMQKKQTEQAVKHFREAIEVQPTNALGYLGVGMAYAEAGDQEKALAAWHEGLEHVPSPNIVLNLRLARSLTTWGRLEEAEKPLGVLEAELSSRKTSNASNTALANELNLLRCQWHLGRSEFAQALNVLKSVNLSGPGGPALLPVLELNRAACYAGLLEWDQAATAYDAAAKVARAPLQAWLAAASAWERTGRADLAALRYSKALSKEDCPRSVRLDYARALLVRQMQLPTAERNWETFDDAVAKARAALPGNLSVKLLTVEAAKAKGESKASLHVLEEIVAEEDPDSNESAMPALALAYQQTGQSTKADRIVDKLRRRTGDAWPVMRLRIDLLTRRNEIDQALAELRVQNERITDRDRPELLERMAGLYQKMRDREAGYKELVKLVSDNPGDVQLCWHVYNFATELNKHEEILKYEKQLRELEGPDGTMWRFAQARRLLGESKEVGDESFMKATQLLSQLQGLRPSWVPVPLLAADIAQRQGNSRLAAEQLTRAVDLGARSPLVIQQLVALLNQLGRSTDAEQLLARVGDLGVSESADMTGAAIAGALAEKDTDRALTLAQNGVKTRPEDSTAYWWLGRTLMTAKRTAEAETAFKDAVRKGTQEVRNWLSLVAYYGQTGETEKARSTVKKMEQHLKLPPAQEAFVRAQAHEMAGDLEGADKYYRAAAEAADDDVNVQQRAAVFFEARDRRMAEKCLRQALKISPKAQGVKRGLAMILAGNGEAGWKEAWDLAVSSCDDPPTVVDRRVQVRILLRNGGAEQRASARKLLDKLVAETAQPLPDDVLILAQLEEADKELAAAKKHLLSLGDKSGDAGVLLRVTDFLVRHNEMDEAEPWLKKLEAAAPDGFAPVQLRAQWLKAKERSDEIEPLVAKYKKHALEMELNAQQKAAVLVNCAGLLAAVGEPAAAEATYRELLAIAPPYYPTLGEFFLSQKKPREAIELFIKVSNTDSTAQPVIHLARLLMKYDAVGQYTGAVDKLLARTMKAHGEDPALLLTVAEFRKQQHRRDDAEKLYRRLLEIRPDHGVAANNLAWMLSERPEDCDEALRLVDKALEQLGHNPEVLDTKGMILLRQHHAPEAVDTLKQATKSPGANPSSYFHLSLAYFDAGKKDRAREELKTFRKLRPDTQQMSEEERQQLAELDRALAQ